MRDRDIELWSCDIRMLYKDGCFLLQCLMMFQVPFMEDVRQYTFASLPGARKHFEPSGMLCTHVASFPGLPRFCSLVCVSRSSASVYYTECKLKNKKRGRPGNEASTHVHLSIFTTCIYSAYTLREREGSNWADPTVLCSALNQWFEGSWFEFCVPYRSAKRRGSNSMIVL